MSPHTAMSAQALSKLTGHKIGLSEWFPVTQDAINLFADVTRDWQDIHVDAVTAAQGPFGGTIAHGFLSLSLLSAMFENGGPQISDLSMAMNYGFNRIRFLTPVRSGQRVRGKFALKDMTERKPGQWHLVLDVEIQVEGGEKPAAIAEWIVLCLTTS